MGRHGESEGRVLAPECSGRQARQAILASCLSNSSASLVNLRDDDNTRPKRANPVAGATKTHDVVFQLTSFCKAFGEQRDPLPPQEELKNFLATRLGRGHDDKMSDTDNFFKKMHWYCVWNVRKQSYEDRYGITRGDILSIIKHEAASSSHQHGLEAYLRVCFEMAELGHCRRHRTTSSSTIAAASPPTSTPAATP